MCHLKRILAVSGLTGWIAALAFAAPAGATDVDRLKGACITQGTAKVNPPIPFTGGAGTYTFNDLTFTCVDVELSKGSNVAVGLIVLDITSPGNYTNRVCGTGKVVSGNATVNYATTTALVGWPKTDTPSEWQWIANGLDYTIEFVALNGLLKWTSPEAQKLDVDVPKVLTSGPTGFPGGYVLILPDETKASPLPGACTKAFQVVAALAIDWSPNQAPKPGGDLIPDPNEVLGEVGEVVGDLLEPPPPPPPGMASDTCQVQGGAAAVGEGGDAGVARGKVFVWQESPTRIHVCVRAQNASGSGAGGMVTIDATGSPGVTPVVENSDTGLAECNTLVFKDEDPWILRVTRSDPSVPGRTSVCVEVSSPSVTKRVTLGTGGSLNQPEVIWTPDPDTPGL